MNIEPVLLQWLPRPPAEFRSACKELSSGQADLGVRVQSLATHYLEAPQAALFGKTLQRLRAEGADLNPLAPLKLGVVANATYDFIATALPAAAARHGISLEVHLSGLDQVEQEVLDPASSLKLAKPDVVLVAVDHRWLGLDRPALQGDAEDRVQAAVDRLHAVASAVVEVVGATPMLSTIPAPALPLFGAYDRRHPGTVRSMIGAFNGRLPELCSEMSALLLDPASVAESVGLAKWFDDGMYALYKLPFWAEAVPLYCDMVGRVLGALRGKARKCLVLDLDNTCWGGVIGDDGLEGICIGGGGAAGDAFLAVQRMALELKERGIVLAVSSKNDDAVAREPFRSHPHMLLKESDIAVFQANWESKSSNLEAIARELDIGIDALVLLDDNGAERAQVRAALPMVAVPELPNDPATYPAMLLSAGYFEALSFSSEDRTRAASYAANAKRADILKASRTVEDYLASLEMKIGCRPFDSINRSRVSQLINKTNQFNLTTKRYTEAQVAAMEGGSVAFTLQAQLSDRYGDFGMIGVIIADVSPSSGPTVWEIDTWLMSCRVLGRRVDEAMLGELVRAARNVGVCTLVGRYLPSSKNGMVADHFDKLGFQLTRESSDGAREYAFKLSDFVAPQLPFASD